MRPGVLYHLFHLLPDLLHSCGRTPTMLVQCLSSGLIPLLLFASQDVSCPTQLPYPICSEERTTTSYKKKGSGGSGNSVTKEERNEPMVWDEPFWGAGEIAAECGMEPITIRLCVAQWHHINVPADRKPHALLAQISPIVREWVWEGIFTSAYFYRLGSTPSRNKENKTINTAFSFWHLCLKHRVSGFWQVPLFFFY